MYLKERGGGLGTSSMVTRYLFLLSLWAFSLYLVSNSAKKYAANLVEEFQMRLDADESKYAGFSHMLEEKLQSFSREIEGIQRQANQIAPPQTAATGMDDSSKLQITKSLVAVDRQIFSLWGQIRSKMPERIYYRKAKAVIVTGADEKYFFALQNLIGSVHFWDPSRNIVVFDLGISQENLKKLNSIDRVKVFPSPIKSNLKNYAWKAYCIRYATERYGKAIWLDAGSDLRGDPKKIDQILEDEDAFFVQGQDEDMTPWSHPQTLDFFRTNKVEMKGKYSFSGNLQGYVYDSQAYWDVLMVVEKCCQITECIAPQGSSLSNHRYDQIAMSSAIYTNPRLIITPHTELLAAVRLQLDPNHKTESSHIVWSARGASHEYMKYIKQSGVVFDAPELSELVKS